ncbi:2465_t:CDS:2, partial [Acaulospora colombiana]
AVVVSQPMFAGGSKQGRGHQFQPLRNPSQEPCGTLALPINMPQQESEFNKLLQSIENLLQPSRTSLPRKPPEVFKPNSNLTLLLAGDNTKILRRYQAQDYPLTLYRVQYEGCQTRRDRSSNELRATSSAIPQTKSELREMVDKHLDWACWEPSPFISLFSDEEHAINWGRRLLRRRWGMRNKKFTLLSFQIPEQTAMVFSVSDLQTSLGVVTWNGKLAHDEYLCFGRIPLNWCVESSTHSLEYSEEDEEITEVYFDFHSFESKPWFKMSIASDLATDIVIRYIWPIRIKMNANLKGIGLPSGDIIHHPIPVPPQLAVRN